MLKYQSCLEEELWKFDFCSNNLENIISCVNLIIFNSICIRPSVEISFHIPRTSSKLKRRRKLVCWSRESGLSSCQLELTSRLPGKQWLWDGQGQGQLTRTRTHLSSRNSITQTLCRTAYSVLYFSNRKLANFTKENVSKRHSVGMNPDNYLYVLNVHVGSG